MSYPLAHSAMLEEIQLTDLKGKNARVKTLYSGISRGTESLVYKGQVPESEKESMRCPHQIGDFSFPVSYGYACVGEVIEIQSDDAQLDIGDLVFVLHPHQDILTVCESACNKLPSTLPAAKAVLSANMETALNATWDAQLAQTSKHVVIGAGVVGLLTGFCIKSETGIAPTIIDTNRHKQAIAEELGLIFHTPESFSASKPGLMERIFNTSASGAGLQMAIDMAAFEAKIIEMSWYGAKPVTLELGGAFHSRRLQLISSQVGHVAPAKRATHSYAMRMQEAMSLLAAPELDSLLEPAISFDVLPSHLHDIFSDKSSALCQLVNYKHS